MQSKSTDRKQAEYVLSVATVMLRRLEMLLKYSANDFFFPTFVKQTVLTTD